MKFAYGCTRFVILTGPFAIKIARFRPFLCIFRLIQRACQGTLETRLKNHHPNPILGALRYLFAGVHANLAERRAWCHSSDHRIAPTYASILGIVNIQERGEPISEDDLRSAPFRELVDSTMPYVGETMLRPVQFALFVDGIRMVDYGDHNIAEYVMRTSKEVSRQMPAAAST